MIIDCSLVYIMFSCPPQWTLYYGRQNGSTHFDYKTDVTFEQLQLLLETHGYEINDILKLISKTKNNISELGTFSIDSNNIKSIVNFRIDTKNIKHNI